MGQTLCEAWKPSRQIKRAHPSKEVRFVAMTGEPAVTDTESGQEPLQEQSAEREGCQGGSVG